MNIVLRSCVPGDEALLSLLGGATFLEAFADVLNGDDILAHCQHQHSPEVYRAWLEDNSVRVWIAETEAGHTPIGYLILMPSTLTLEDSREEREGSDLEVKRIYLLHRFQGMGIGKRLMQSAISFAREKGCSRLLLGVYGGNDAAIAFYERVGFAKVGTRRFTVGSTVCDDFILGMTL